MTDVITEAVDQLFRDIPAPKAKPRPIRPRCMSCGGLGYRVEHLRAGWFKTDEMRVECTVCKGRGRL